MRVEVTDMPDIVAPEIEAYAQSNTTAAPEHLVAVETQTKANLQFPGMMVGLLEGRFLEMLVYALKPRHVLEIGTYSGYSALAMAAGLPAGGRITTCELSPEHAEAARHHIDSSPYSGLIEVLQGPARDTLEKLSGPFDLVFIDADKTNYLAYYEAVLPKLASGGLIVVDNTLWSGRVLDGSDESADTLAIRAFNDALVNDERVVVVQLTVRDGVTLIRRADKP